MLPSVLTVSRQGKRWGVSADGEVIALAGTRKAAAELARSAAGILRDSGAATEVVVSPEPRSFREE